MVTISIKDSLFETISKIAKQENTTESKILEDIIEKGLETKKLKSNRTDGKLGFKDLIGKYTANEPFNAVEEKRKMRKVEL